MSNSLPPAARVVAPDDSYRPTCERSETRAMESGREKETRYGVVLYPEPPAGRPRDFYKSLARSIRAEREFVHESLRRHDSDPFSGKTAKTPSITELRLPQTTSVPGTRRSASAQSSEAAVAFAKIKWRQAPGILHHSSCHVKIESRST